MPHIRATDGDRVIDRPSEEQLHDLLADMNLSCNFVIVERLATDMDPDSNPDAYFIQVALNEEPNRGSYQVEYRDGNSDAHFQAIVLRESEWGRAFDSGFDQVVQVVCDWAADRPGWRTTLPWKPLDLNSKHEA